ncbi:MAG: Glu/Leu/Phe/Val dehydrogenase dimerization domain-containing protein [Ignavibacteriales bacterium]
MEIFKAMAKDGHEQLVFCRNRAAGLKAIIAIHDTSLGPALGGCRMWPYTTEEDAVVDVLRLSKGMTYKSAAAGCNYGGGKMVVWGDPQKDKSEAMFRALGRFVEGLNGRFLTGTDVGTVSGDFVWASYETDKVNALPEEYGGSGDSSIITAFGVWKGMKACAREVFGTESLKGLRIAVQGVGKVGFHLVGHLIEEGASVTIADINKAYVERVTSKYAVTVVEPDAVYDVDCDVFSPCALGAVVNDDTIKRLKCKIIAGAANNQLKEDRHGHELKARGILYAPDYVINAGGMIQVVDELQGYNKERAFKKAAGIQDLLAKVFSISKRDNIPTHKAADVMVEERIQALSNVSQIYLRA